MANKKKKKNLDKKVSLMVMVGVLILMTAALVFVLIQQTSNTNHGLDQKSRLESALTSVSQVYKSFSSSIQEEKTDLKNPRNLCSATQAEFGSPTYYCGPDTSFAVKNIQEDDYQKLAKVLFEGVEKENAFTDVKIEQPTERSTPSGLVSTINAKYRNSGPMCHGLWEYARDSSTAYFGFGCHESSTVRIYPSE